MNAAQELVGIDHLTMLAVCHGRTESGEADRTKLRLE